MSSIDATSWDVMWWTIMVVIAAINWLIAGYMFSRSVKQGLREPANTKYFFCLRILGIVFSSVALYRSIFVSSYPNRLAWFDTVFNSPLIIRSLALLAEMSYIGMIAIILLKLNRDIPLIGNGKRDNIRSLLAKTPYVAVGCIFLAQFFAFGGLITQYLVLFAIEETLWAIAFLSIVPLIAVRLKQMKKQKFIERGYKTFLIIMAVWCVGYLVFQCYMLPFIHYAELSQDIGRVVPQDALRQAIFSFTATRDFDTWGGLGFFIWHSGYFSICVWMVLFFMSAPRKHVKVNQA